MNKLVDINVCEKTILFLLVIVSILILVMLIMNHHQERRYFPFMLVDSVLIIISYLEFNLLVMTMYCRYNGKELTGFREAWADKLVIVHLLVHLAVGLAVLCLFLEDYRWRKGHISVDSIKESIDFIPYGLCCYYEEGMPRLINRAMNQISMDIFGRFISNASEFWEKINSEKRTEWAERLDYKELPAWMTGDKKVWSFKREKIAYEKGFLYEIIATDITEEHEKSEKLSEDNKRMRIVTEKLREYSKNVTRLTIEKEILDAKVQVHSELGQTLVATRRYLSDKDIDEKELLGMWNKNIKLLKKESLNIAPDDYEILKANAEQLGISLVMPSVLPEDEDAKSIIISAVNECITNTYKYSESKSLELKISEDINSLVIKIVNNGDVPKEEIKEKGGLKNLRNMIETKGGSMKTTTNPCFCITIILNK